ncbi:MAG TPA: zinc-ribbon domain-containing protein [Pyrinomonadaceae bacterium]|nr:zinc-ribbon domain-containing protein [Pyrinomonadaceae bacterium]
MILCSNCGKEIEEGQNFCPYCAAPTAVGGGTKAAEASGATRVAEGSGLEVARGERSPFLDESDLEPPRAVPLASFGDAATTGDRAQRKLFVVVGVASVALIALIALVLATGPGRAWLSSIGGRAQPDSLANALRPGNPEFEQYREQVFLDFDADEDAVQQARPLGDVILRLKPTVRNFTGRTINGLEVRAAGYDLDGQVVKERTFVLIPKRQSTLEPNKTMTTELMIEGVRPDNIPASLKVEVTGVTFR